MIYPDVTIVMTTCFFDQQRKELAEKTLKSWSDNLVYEGDLYLHVADDGSVVEWYPETNWNFQPITFSRQERRGVGASLNQGFSAAFNRSPIVFYAVDDWLLLHPFDISPWVQLLMEREDVGIVRLGPPHPHLRGVIEPFTTNWQGWGIRLDRFGLTVGHRPELFHKRMIDYYGPFDEMVNAQECERLYSVRYADNPDGPDIVYALPHPFYHYHLDVVPSTSHLEPGGK